MDTKITCSSCGSEMLSIAHSTNEKLTDLKCRKMSCPDRTEFRVFDPDKKLYEDLN
jgi:hypothetical protein